MTQAREDKEENIRISPFVLDDVDMLDIRFWKNTKAGPRPTKRGIAIKRALTIRMIIALQRVNIEFNKEQAQKEAMANRG